MLVDGWSDDQLHAAADWLAGEVLAFCDADPVTADKLARIEEGVRAQWLERGETVRQARAQVKSMLRDGGSTCPCCGRNAQARRRKFSALMAASIVWLVRRSAWQVSLTASSDIDTPQGMRGAGWVCWAKDCVDSIHRMHEISRLVVYGLAEECDRPGWSGWYRPTDKGAQLVNDPKATVPAEVWTWNRGALAFTADHVTLREAMGVKFVLEDLYRADVNDGTQWAPVPAP